MIQKYLDRDWRTITDEKEKYARYLASRDWALRRRAVIERAGGKCERCRVATIDQVHHLTYIRKYEELVTDLQGLCRPCHEFTHGITDKDPILKLPPMFMGRPVSAIYLAGSCRAQNWRGSITDQYRLEQSEDVSERLESRPTVEVCKGKKIRYTGPFVETEHGSVGLNQHGSICRDRSDIIQQAGQGILDADLIFAWIDCTDCFGTIAEIGFARGHGKRIIIAGPAEYPDLWFVYAMANVSKFDEKNAMTALEHFLK